MNQIHYGPRSITSMRKDNRNAFYNKKRNYPNAEERQYDDLLSRKVLLTKPDQKTKGYFSSRRKYFRNKII